MGQVLEEQCNIATQNNRPVAQVRMLITRRISQDRHYDDPTATEIAAIYVGDDGATPDPRDREIAIYNAGDNNTTKIKAMSQNEDPVIYPLLFYSGEFGWHVDVQRNQLQQRENARNPRMHVSLNEIYAYRVAVHEGFSAIHRSKLLFQTISGGCLHQNRWQ